MSDGEIEAGVASVFAILVATPIESDSRHRHHRIVNPVAVLTWTCVMWDWINCHLLGRHEHSVVCEHGSMHLRCLRCGYRSTGWQLDPPALGLQAASLTPRRPLLRLIARRHA